MREILFKAKRDGSGEWVEGCYAECKGKTFIGIGTSIGIDALKGFCVPVIKWFEVDPENLCQFTGLYDKNGKRIWENDIVFVTDENDCSGQISTGIGNVIFIEGMWYIDGRPQEGLYDINKVFQIEVIGNAFDNQELLQEESDE